jgi:hypothetical protein
MSKTFFWILKYILLPLIPFILAAVLRYIYDTGSLSFDILDPALLSFSMIILSYTVILQAGKLEDKNLSNDLSLIYLFPLAVFFILFVSSSMFSIEIQNFLENIINIINTNMNNSILILNKDILMKIEILINQRIENINRINLIRFLAIIFTVPTILYSIYAKFQYKLDGVE